MINLIKIGYDIGDLTVNAFNAIIESDIIINYDNIDLSPLETYMKDKEIFINEEDSEEISDENINSQDSLKDAISEEFSEDSLKDAISEEFSEDSLKDAVSVEVSEDIIQLDESEEISKVSDELEDSEDSSQLDEESRLIYSKLNKSYSLIELAISKSLDNNVALICSNNRSIHGIDNLLIQISSKYEDINLNIYPGVSPIDYSSSILGAPMNDFVSINLNNPIVSQEELENKINSALENDFIIFIHNIKGKDNDNFNKLKEIVNGFNNELWTGIVNDSSCEICQFKDIDDGNIEENSTLVIGNKLTYQLEDYMVSSCDYIVEPKFISQNIDFFERYLKDETPKGLDYDCEYLPCHKSLESCDFCYCPFYPCADGITGGEWIKGKDIWSCQYCDWIHLEEPCQAIREGLEDILKDKNDLKTKHIELLKLRRQCLLKTLK